VREAINAEAVESNGEGLFGLSGCARDCKPGVRRRDSSNCKALGLEPTGDGGKLIWRGPELRGKLLRREPVAIVGGGSVDLRSEQLIKSGTLEGARPETDRKSEWLRNGELAGVYTCICGDHLTGTGGDGCALRVQGWRGHREGAEEREGAFSW